MKTAMQELLENLQKQFEEQTHPVRIDGTYFLEKEKEQIVDAFIQGGEQWNSEDASIEYYNQTYNQNK
jgi:DNA phosphorothioation-dependent restriction protein DptG